MALLPFWHRPVGRAMFYTSRAMHHLLLLAVGMLALISLLLAGTAWRLSQGPIQLGWLANRLTEALAPGTGQAGVSVGELELVWEGFHGGTDHPLDLRATGIRLTGATGRTQAAIPAAHIGLSLSRLLLGQIVPQTVELERAEIFLTRELNGEIDLGWASDDPPAKDEGKDTVPAFTDHIQRLRLRDTLIAFRDRETGFTARAQGAEIALARVAGGRIGGTIRAQLGSGGQEAALNAALTYMRGGSSTVAIRLSPFVPGQIPNIPDALAGIGVPVSFSATAMLDAALKPERIRAALDAGAGGIAMGTGIMKLRTAHAELSGTPELLTLDKLHLDLAAAPSGEAETVDIAGTVAHSANRLAVSATVRADRIDLADLPKLWPAGTGGGARQWVTQHILGGIATNVSASLSAEADDGFNDVVLTKATGDGDAANVSFTWIDNMLPVDHAKVHIHLADPDTMDVAVTGGHQRIRGGSPDLIVGGQVRITGLAGHDQAAVIHGDVAGPLVSTMTLLKEPRLRLLSAHPIGLKPDAGTAAAALMFAFPLEDRLSMDDVAIAADVRLQGASVPAAVAGRTLSDGAFDIKADKDGLTFKGTAVLSAIPVALEGAMDFRAGPPDQVLQRVVATARPAAAQLNAAGVPLGDIAAGPVGVSATVVEHRAGDGSVAISADLTGTTLTLSPLAWTKQAGSRAVASATLLMTNDRLVRIGGIALDGEDIGLSGSADAPGGRVGSLTLRDIRLARTRGAGEVRFGSDGTIGLTMRGSTLDLEAKMLEESGDVAGTPPETKPLWTLNARFDRALLAHNETATGLILDAGGAGETIRSLHTAGTLTGGGQFSADIVPGPDGRHLAVRAADAGHFLLATDTAASVQGGKLSVDGVFAGPLRLYPVTGQAVLEGSVIRNSPLIGKLLQAVTLYGLVDALRGPGMRFSQVTIPFRYEGNDLVLKDVVASNSSLGVTAGGRIGLHTKQIDIGGTLVPAYFFNSIPGQIPLLGKLFSPEAGGGLFSTRFGLSGSLDDPDVSVNPVSALTPGFLRDIFNIFNRPPAEKTSPPGQAVPH